jgi:hypothetical protein
VCRSREDAVGREGLLVTGTSPQGNSAARNRAWDTRDPYVGDPTSPSKGTIPEPIKYVIPTYFNVVVVKGVNGKLN